MDRRQYLNTMAALVVAQSSLVADTERNGRFLPAICAYSFRKQLKDGSFTYADLIRMGAETQSNGVDLTTYWLPRTTDETILPLKKLAYKFGIWIYSIGTRVKMVQPPEARNAELESLRKWLDVAERIGASHMRIFGGSVPAGATEDQALGWAIETLKRSAEEAGKKGITLGIEDDTGITMDAHRMVEIVQKAGSEWAGINLDIGNFPDNAYAQIELCAPYATNVHFKEQVHMDGREQPADWPRILKILGAAGYEGHLALEYESMDAPLTNVPKLIVKMRATIAKA